MAEPQRLQRMSTLDRKNGWWSKDTVAVVTGGHHGVGFEITRQLGRLGLTVVLAARDEDKGQNAADSLKRKGLSIVAHQLDITDEESVQTFADWIKRHVGGINILVNSAGIKIQEINFENARDIIFTNYVSLRALTSVLLPLFRPSSAGGRIVNMSSLLGSIKCMKNPAVRKLLADEKNLSVDMINSLATKFLEDVEAEKFQSPSWAWSLHHTQYAESKAFVNAYTRVLAKELAKDDPEDQEIFVNAATHNRCDGTKHDEDTEPAEAWADTPVWLALLPRENYPNGKLFASRQEAQF